MIKIENSPEEQELMRFFIAGKAFMQKTSKSVFMPFCMVDDVWHNLLKDKERYTHLTLSLVGSKIKHLSQKGEGEIEWVSEYEKMFGKLSEIWFTSSNGKLDSLSYQRYLQTGKMYAAWNCNPAYKPPVIKKTVIKKIPLNMVS